ncbi:shikimate dehydrogenase [Deinococcus metalli]|uniref:Shikimate 5-dehydrogenase n=1 Tax=Deinococcus metalli TaxID=1141878 RepID=A0A7W8KID2_9DEIO|nr:shikimate 5-dehydrogenase [Deinococcus metalli]MBB5377581.1 shikimate dehydrogenase [Deinococcus metalli]GHF51854.1 shikimate 5-dehydrogenase [Deinococcus metalli]
MRVLDRDTQLCMSLASRPGNFGTRFHNHLYAALDLNFVYKAFTTEDLEGAVRGIRALGIRGCAVSMPFKEAVIPLLDELDPSAAAIGSVNTIVNTAGHLKAYNTDYTAAQLLTGRHALDPAARVVLRGSGGMGKAVASALRDAGFTHGVLVARNEGAGRVLADRCGWTWQPDVPDAQPGDLLVNVTPIGMAGGPEEHALAFTPQHVAAAATVFDVVALPSETPLIAEARRQGKAVVTGLEVVALQALEQFVLYTGVRPTGEQVAAAVAFARG